ncbi:PEP-CTERM sorting domain-containing protein [Sedimentisphaera salicampi]|uniref:PEP-CTERM sorting domain-containing protein n=1 Tax=Sedimentisphaera salicampi TaxID=1941349 RepID=UPI000B9B14E2|nr:PEP-CTERM sorting domain-containing protein [Sedimentisphaera salicampi]OXU15709.1 PEP-CTERM protein sorting domain protein [Sedimentisphaera salicampi]
MNVNLKLVLVAVLLASVCGFAANIEIWSDDMSSLDDWTVSSPDNVGLIDGNTKVQLNSWWGANGNTGYLSRGTGELIQDETEYVAIFLVDSFSDGKDITISVTDVDNGGADIATAAATLNGNGAEYTLDFSTVGTENDAVVGNEMGVYVNGGWWKNFAVDNIKIEQVPEPASMIMLGAGGIGLLARRRKS